MPQTGLASRVEENQTERKRKERNGAGCCGKQRERGGGRKNEPISPFSGQKKAEVDELRS
jgi:hypothetical protein